MKRIFKHFLFCFLLLCLSLCLAQTNKTNTLNTLLKTDKEDTLKVNHLNAFGRKLMYGNPDTAIILSNQALILADKLQWKKGKANSLGNLGTYCRLKGEYTKALDYYFEALKIKEDTENKNGLATRLGNIAIVYHEQGDYPKALDYYFKALKIEEELGNKNGIAINFANIGIVYSDQADYSKALDYHLKALESFEELIDKNGIASCLGNIGGVYYSQADYSNINPPDKKHALALSLEYFSKALKADEELDDKYGIAADLGGIGSVLGSQKKYPESLEYYLKALKINEEIGSKNSITIYLASIGSLYMSMQKYKKSFDFLYRALAVDDSIGAIDRLKDDYFKLSSLYENSSIALPDSIGQKTVTLEQMRLRSLYYYKRYVAIRDTLFSEENKKQLVRKEMNFEFDKKEAETKAEQEKQLAVTAAESRRQRIILVLVSCFLLLVLVLAGLIFRSLRITRKQKYLIERQKQIVEEHQKEILDSIYYARRIQTALLPTEKYITRQLACSHG